MEKETFEQLYKNAITKKDLVSKSKVLYVVAEIYNKKLENSNIPFDKLHGAQRVLDNFIKAILEGAIECNGSHIDSKTFISTINRRYRLITKIYGKGERRK